MPSDPGSAKGGLPPSPNYIHENPPHWTQARLKAHSRQLPVPGAWDAAPTPTAGCPGCPARGPPSLLPRPGRGPQTWLHKLSCTAARSGGRGSAGRGRPAQTGDRALPPQRGRGRAQDKRDEERERAAQGLGQGRPVLVIDSAGRPDRGGARRAGHLANQERALHELTRRLQKIALMSATAGGAAQPALARASGRGRRSPGRAEDQTRREPERVRPP